MTGPDSACRTRSHCRRFYPDERYTPPTGDCGRLQAGASPASTWSCPRAHNRSLWLRISSPIGQSPAPNPPGRSARRSGRPAWNYPPCSRSADLLSLAASRPSRAPLRGDHLAGRGRRPPPPPGHPPQQRPRPPGPRLRTPRRPRQHPGRGTCPRRRSRLRRPARPCHRYTPVVAAAPRGGRADGPGPGDRRPPQGTDRPRRHPGGPTRHRLLPLGPHGHRDDRLRLRGSGSPPLAPDVVRPARSRHRLRPSRRLRQLRPGQAGLPLATGRRGQLVPRYGAAQFTTAVPQPK